MRTLWLNLSLFLACSAANAQELAFPTAEKTVRLICAIERESLKEGFQPFETNNVWCQLTDTTHIPEPFGGSGRTSVETLYEGASQGALAVLSGAEESGTRYLRRVCPTMLEALLDEMALNEDLADAAMIPNSTRIAVNCSFSMPVRVEN